jgi:ERCC4-type nuclease
MNPGSEPVVIVADDREIAGGVVAELRTLTEIVVEVKRLVTGDFEIGRVILVERKTLADFAASLIDGRLFRQCAAIAADGRRAVLILEGTRKTCRDIGVTREALQGALITVGVFYGLTVLRSRDAAETARLILYLGRQARRLARGALPRPGYRPKGKRARQLFILQGLPGVGPERAARLLDHFGTVQRIATATANEMAGLDGIGAKTAGHIRWLLEEET